MLIELQSTTEKHAEHCNCKILILNTETGRENNTAMVYSEKRAISSVETGKYESAAQWYQQTQVDRTLLYSLPTVHSGISSHKWTGLCCTPCPLSTLHRLLSRICLQHSCINFTIFMHSSIHPCCFQLIHDIIHSFISYP